MEPTNLAAANETQAYQCLARFAVSRNSADMEPLFLFYQKEMYNFACRFLRNAEDAEDAVQAAFMALLHRAGEPVQITSLRGWVLGFVRKTCLMKSREEARRSRREEKAGREQWSGKMNETTQNAAERELAAVVLKVVQDLPLKYREPVLICYYHGFSPKEAAQVMNQPEGTVRSLLSRALAKVRATLEAGGITAGGAVLLEAMKAAPLEIAPASLQYKMTDILKNSVVRQSMRTGSAFSAKIAAAVILGAAVVIGAAGGIYYQTSPSRPNDVVEKPQITGGGAVNFEKSGFHRIAWSFNQKSSASEIFNANGANLFLTRPTLEKFWDFESKNFSGLKISGGRWEWNIMRANSSVPEKEGTGVLRFRFHKEDADENGESLVVISPTDGNFTPPCLVECDFGLLKAGTDGASFATIFEGSWLERDEGGLVGGGYKRVEEFGILKKLNNRSSSWRLFLTERESFIYVDGRPIARSVLTRPWRSGKDSLHLSFRLTRGEAVVDNLRIRNVAPEEVPLPSVFPKAAGGVEKGLTPDLTMLDGSWTWRDDEGDSSGCLEIRQGALLLPPLLNPATPHVLILILRNVEPDENYQADIGVVRADDKRVFSCLLRKSPNIKARYESLQEVRFYLLDRWIVGILNRENLFSISECAEWAAADRLAVFFTNWRISTMEIKTISANEIPKSLQDIPSLIKEAQKLLNSPVKFEGYSFDAR
jgi:RNA polymerase sigma factor (sigma-70 family)